MPPDVLCVDIKQHFSLEGNHVSALLGLLLFPSVRGARELVSDRRFCYSWSMFYAFFFFCLFASP